MPAASSGRQASQGETPTRASNASSLLIISPSGPWSRRTGKKGAIGAGGRQTRVEVEIAPGHRVERRDRDGHPRMRDDEVEPRSTTMPLTTLSAVRTSPGTSPAQASNRSLRKGKGRPPPGYREHDAKTCQPAPAGLLRAVLCRLPARTLVACKRRSRWMRSGGEAHTRRRRCLRGKAGRPSPQRVSGAVRRLCATRHSRSRMAAIARMRLRA